MGKIVEKRITPETKDICRDFFRVRSVVAQEAWRRMREEGVPWGTAISEAWRETKQKCSELGYVV